MIMMKVELVMLTTSFDRCQGKGGSLPGEISQLPAGTEHVPPSALPNEHIETGISENGLKMKNRLFGRAMKRAVRKLIERNQIDLAPQGAQQAYQTVGISRMVVDTGEQHILEGESLARRKRIAATGSQQ